MKVWGIDESVCIFLNHVILLVQKLKVFLF